MRPLTDYLDDSIVRKVAFISRLTTSLRSRLPPHIAERCCVAGVNQNTLSVLVDSSSWTLTLRYQQREILKHLNTEFRAELQPPLTRLKVRIASTSTATRIPLERPQLSMKNAAVVSSAAVTVADPQLRSALMRLAKRGEARKR